MTLGKRLKVRERDFTDAEAKALLAGADLVDVSKTPTVRTNPAGKALGPLASSGRCRNHTRPHRRNGESRAAYRASPECVAAPCRARGLRKFCSIPGWFDRRIERFHCQMQVEADGMRDEIDAPAPSSSMCGTSVLTDIERMNASRRRLLSSRAMARARVGSCWFIVTPQT